MTILRRGRQRCSAARQLPSRQRVEAQHPPTPAPPASREASDAAGASRHRRRLRAVCIARRYRVQCKASLHSAGGRYCVHCKTLFCRPARSCSGSRHDRISSDLLTTARHRSPLLSMYTARSERQVAAAVRRDGGGSCCNMRSSSSIGRPVSVSGALDSICLPEPFMGRYGAAVSG